MFKDDEKTAKLRRMLYAYTYIEFEIEDINEKIIDLSEVIKTQSELQIPALTGMPRGNEISDPVYSIVEKIMITYGQEIAKLENRIEKAFERRNYIENLLGVLEPIEKRIIELKYFKKYKTWMICSSVTYEKSQVYRLHDKAFEKLLEVFEHENYS